MKSNIIYGLVESKTNLLRYVGKTTNGMRRIKQHFNAYALNNLKDNCHKWLKELVSSNQYPEIIIIEEGLSRKDLSDAEEFWIAYFREIGCPLTNMRNGGEGIAGFKYSQAQKEATYAV